MPTSNYQGFFAKKEVSAGVVNYFGAGQSVIVRTHGSTSTLTTLTTDADGYVAGGTLSVAAGTVVHFVIENLSGSGANGITSQTTT